jgi:hypothetical protein
VDRSVLSQGQDRLMVIGVLGKPVLWIMEILWTPLEHAFTVDTYAATVDYAKGPDQHWVVVKADEREVE